MESNYVKSKGYHKCPSWLNRTYRRAVNYDCQLCHKNESEVGTLTPHRVRRGNVGGLYTILPLNHKSSNVKVVCLNCHKLLHSGEFNRK